MRSARRRERVLIGDCSAGAGEVTLPLTVILVRSGLTGVEGAGDDGSGGIVGSRASSAAVRSASFVSTYQSVHVFSNPVSFQRRTGIYIRLMRLLACISLVKSGRILVDPVAHLNVLLIPRSCKSLRRARQDSGGMMTAQAKFMGCVVEGRKFVVECGVVNA